MGNRRCKTSRNIKSLAIESNKSKLMGKLDGKWGSSTRPGANGNDGSQPNEDVIFHHNFTKTLGISGLSKQSEDRSNGLSVPK